MTWQPADVESFARPGCAAEAGQVRRADVRVAGQFAGERQEVAVRAAQSVHAHDFGGAGRAEHAGVHAGAGDRGELRTPALVFRPHDGGSTRVIIPETTLVGLPECLTPEARPGSPVSGVA
jgi:hypothetical protein